MLKKLKQKIAMWLWRDNEWTKCIDDIEKAVDDLRTLECFEVVMKWKFNYLPSPPGNSFIIRIQRDRQWEKAGAQNETITQRDRQWEKAGAQSDDTKINELKPNNSRQLERYKNEKENQKY